MTLLHNLSTLTWPETLYLFGALVLAGLAVANLFKYFGGLLQRR